MYLKCLFNVHYLNKPIISDKNHLKRTNWITLYYIVGLGIIKVRQVSSMNVIVSCNVMCILIPIYRCKHTLFLRTIYIPCVWLVPLLYLSYKMRISVCLLRQLAAPRLIDAIKCVCVWLCERVPSSIHFNQMH